MRDNVFNSRKFSKKSLTVNNFFYLIILRQLFDNPDEPMVLKCNARVIGELKIEDCHFNVQWLEDSEDINSLIRAGWTFSTQNVEPPGPDLTLHCSIN
jgi:hypothetical protein